MSFLSRVWLRALREWWRLTVPVRLRLKGVTVGNGATFYGMPIISRAPGSEIRIGNRVTICSDSRFTALGVGHPAVFRTLSPGARIEIGEDSGISGGAFCAAESILIGKACLIGADVVIADTDFHPVSPKNRRYSTDGVRVSPVAIADNVFIGTRAVVLKGVSVGPDSVVGAMSVVVRNVSGSVVVAGNPARAVSQL